MPTLFKGESERDAGELLGRAMQTKDFEREKDMMGFDFKKQTNDKNNQSVNF